jgi:hypothetical protein
MKPTSSAAPDEKLSLLAKLIMSVIIVAVAGIPTWIVVGVKNLLGAETLWQKLIVYGVGYYVLGAIQIALGFLALAFLVLIWFGGWD